MHTFRRMNPAVAAVLRYIDAGADGEAATAAPTPTDHADSPAQPNEADAGTEATTDGDEPDEALGEPGKKALQAEREAKKVAEQSAKDAQTALAAEQQAHTTAKERVAALEADLAQVKEQAATAAATQRELDLMKALYEHRVPAEHRHLVKGDTAEELMAAAESIAQLAARPGVVPLSGTTGTTSPHTSSLDAGRDLARARPNRATSR
ncbi:hypothetical protein, partial [Micrococcus sp.]|uniref:hypothetical protein n=1 Tax=Micrococcus sp. TaxID=1271 RepID=UPI0026DB6E18